MYHAQFVGEFLTSIYNLPEGQGTIMERSEHKTISFMINISFFLISSYEYYGGDIVLSEGHLVYKTLRKLNYFPSGRKWIQVGFEILTAVVVKSSIFSDNNAV
jgi:hypothetical protein